MDRTDPSERQLALFGIAAHAIALVRDGLIRPGDLAEITAVIQALIKAEHEEGGRT
ncbi:hypothetical protein GOFOIKOB_0061 [Methylobacterium tardum]|uniref:Uncharacterized protein n=1 Tax=Methylobacterium tardum TaxID=374432 RepID=A0AA37TEE8_9HYPH|nr:MULTISPECIES: hypothetical protein [Methylobacterium]KZB97771.1 hypothetical protein AU375_06101 [Methylobacterium radiotolerans]GJE47042.1 hypothetical protein GOFOIKOB_0061 [Methylobacterium tardum]GLS71585.1 hypothetical protein GCM10007890_35980 [Methylobacterium tardum]SFU50431.1 hypothetical protein SAMN02799643_00953 [Methylobacterium sp. UNCCL125]